MKRILPFLLFTCLLSCDDGENRYQCDVLDPANELPWLKEIIQEIEETEIGRQYFYVQQGTYLGRTVFIVNNCCPFCNTIIPVYDCDGDQICTTSECRERILNKTVIWTPSQFSCLI